MSRRRKWSWQINPHESAKLITHMATTREIFSSRGQTQKFKGIGDSEKAGIAIIYQELALVPEMSVYENIFLGHEIKKGFTIDWNETIKQSERKMLSTVRLKVNPSTKVKDLGVG